MASTGRNQSRRVLALLASGLAAETRETNNSPHNMALQEQLRQSADLLRLVGTVVQTLSQVGPIPLNSRSNQSVEVPMTTESTPLTNAADSRHDTWALKLMEG
jgi:hypothetical protein